MLRCSAVKTRWEPRSHPSERKPGAGAHSEQDREQSRPAIAGAAIKAASAPPNNVNRIGTLRWAELSGSADRRSKAQGRIPKRATTELETTMAGADRSPVIPTMWATTVHSPHTRMGVSSSTTTAAIHRRSTEWHASKFRINDPLQTCSSSVRIRGRLVEQTPCFQFDRRQRSRWFRNANITDTALRRCHSDAVERAARSQNAAAPTHAQPCCISLPGRYITSLGSIRGDGRSDMV